MEIFIPRRKWKKCLQVDDVLEINIIWSKTAKKSVDKIFLFHKTRVSLTVAMKIKKEIISASRQLFSNPESGQIELNLQSMKLNHRYLIAGHYKLLYRFDDKMIYIDEVFDTRRDPKSMLNQDRE